MKTKLFFVSFAISAILIIFTDYLFYSLFPISYQSDIQHAKQIFFILASNLILSWYVQRELRLYGHDRSTVFNKSVFFASSVYSIFWILIVDFFFDNVFRDTSLMFQTAKGLFYVFTWSLLVAWFAQKEFDLNQKLGSVFRSSQVGLYTGIIIHEIRTPLDLIQYYANQLSSYSDKEFLVKERINKNIQSLSKTIQFFQKLSRNEPLEKSEISEKVNLAELLNEISQQVLKNDSRINFINQIPKDLDIQGSYGLLSHLFMNLLKNASECLFQLKDDQLEILTTAIHDGHQICVRIENSGSRFHEDQVEKLFKPYISKLKEGESGFGILISQQIAQAHQGQLLVDKKAKRPTFEVWLPAQHI